MKRRNFLKSMGVSAASLVVAAQANVRPDIEDEEGFTVNVAHIDIGARMYIEDELTEKVLFNNLVGNYDNSIKYTKPITVRIRKEGLLPYEANSIHGDLQPAIFQDWHYGS